jgi:hypothetical protein
LTCEEIKEWRAEFGVLVLQEFDPKIIMGPIRSSMTENGIN